MRCLFIYNPQSGKSKISKYVNYITKKLMERFSYVEVIATQSREHTIVTAKSACSTFDYLVFSGGDGTFNDIVTGVAAETTRPILGYIPAGTVNDIAKNLKLSYRPKKAIKSILNGVVITHDVGKIGDRYFMYVAAIGTFTSVSYRTEQRVKKKLGKLAYVIDGIQDVFDPVFTNVSLKSDQVEINEIASLVLVLNSRSVGGVVFNPEGHLNDGYFDVVLVKKDFFGGVLNIIKMFLFKVSRKKKRKFMSVIRSDKMEISVGEDIVWCLDGEQGPKGPIVIENLKEHIQIVVPKRKKKKIELSSN